MVINECGCIVDETLLVKLIENKCKELNKPFKPPYRITALNNNYARVCIAHNWFRVHRIIGEYLFDDINNKHIHHKDSNKLNNSLENLELLTPSQHTTATEMHKYVSKEHLIGFGNRMATIVRRNDITKAEIIRLREKGFTIDKIAEVLNCGVNTVRRRLKN